jgi:Phytanoyl-CoA dioxygenase (PhyH)
VEGNFAGPDGEPRVDLRCHGRALLLLFLFADVGPDDAPTRVRVGSHLDVPPFLADAGDEGRDWFELCGDVVPASADRPVAHADGAAGDVFVCHPFLVHAAQPHRGTGPRLMAQPPLVPTGALTLDEAPPSPVADAVRRGLGR